MALIKSWILLWLLAEILLAFDEPETAVSVKPDTKVSLNKAGKLVALSTAFVVLLLVVVAVGVVMEGAKTLAKTPEWLELLLLFEALSEGSSSATASRFNKLPKVRQQLNIVIH